MGPARLQPLFLLFCQVLPWAIEQVLPWAIEQYDAALAPVGC
ncbi:hypothetical protein [Streptomyces sp. 3N207]